MLSGAMVLAAGVILALMTLGWLASLAWRDASLVDRLWSLGFVAVAWAVWSAQSGHIPRHSLVLAMTTVWGIRLAIHITRRNWGHGEDYRYQAMRRRHGKAFPLVSFFTVFALQGVIMWIIATPLMAALAVSEPKALTPLDAAGAIIWLIGFAFEAVGDAQLARFKAEPANKGKVMDRGLWRYTRHPNYFGDALLWWGIWITCLSAPYGAYTVVSPILMTLLLLKVSGVAMLEKTITERRPAYAEYIRRTSAFFPLPPKKA